MSRETLRDLNTRTLIGNADHRGTAWHYRADLQGDEPNHYPGPIPITDVQRRLFAWQAESRPIAVEVPADILTATHLSADGLPVRWVAVAGRQAICRSDRSDGTVMGLFSDGYARHQYDEWLLTTVANILDADLGISSAGLLRDGAVAWVEVSVPESITTPEGVTFRPNLLATTSFDGSIATTYKRTVTDTVCDNTRDLALAERGQHYKVRHSKHSHARIADAREALAMVHTLGEEFAAEIANLCATPVSPAQWAAFLNIAVPLTDPTGQPLSTRSLTMAQNKRDSLGRLYRHDERVAPWAGTAHGVLQAVNTYEHHEAIVRGAERAERNMLRTITGDFGDLDRTTWQQLNRVLTSI
jgi:phage/plasmid-like protein (TIGR03299 family)